MNEMTNDWNRDASAILPDLVTLRRSIHGEPELGLQNPKTLEKIKVALAGLPLELCEGPSTTGLVAILRGSDNGRTVLLRGDMDALPLHEDTGLDYASNTDGAMHACGHDTHVAMLVGAARMLSAKRDTLAGTVMFMFQPGEEGHHGARFMLDDGLIDPMPDAAFALHIMPNAPHGLFAGRAGPLLASSDKLHIIVTGRGGHASMPQDALDPIPVACEIVSAIQTMITRKVSVFDPAVVTIAHIKAGTTDNIIPKRQRCGAQSARSLHASARPSASNSSGSPPVSRRRMVRVPQSISNRASRLRFATVARLRSAGPWSRISMAKRLGRRWPRR